MTKRAPGKSFREGISLFKIMKMFPDDEAAKSWFIETRWPDGPHCPYCGSINIQSGSKHKTMPYLCREKECAKRFSARTDTAMESSRLGFQAWAIAIYLITTNLKGISSMKLHRELDISQKSAWYLAHRIRKALEDDGGLFSGPVEVDETYMGGRRKNMPKSKRKTLKGRGTADKSIIVGAKDRSTNQVSATVIDNTSAKTLQGFVSDHTKAGAKVFTDDHGGYDGMPYSHESVRHSIGEYVNGEAHTQGIESFWSMLKRAHKGTFHKMSAKHLDRYVKEFAGRHNARQADTIDQMVGIAKRMVGKRLKYEDLIEDNGLSSGARE